ncbi:secreted RxLR effector peptide protein, putative [Phytophthora infestans T30-4]|uniref:Secreted RxLR effector peptide protein, putative n=1 Tax=Phytophthora infestans (strain T30-4) TaxID=403677 RepID=D0NTC3_PHYIT|nr:secreted RxLR effector peptide protein, putative [Phytophthora infestans T30-4]EEY64874.1 secreted RxLR effector peptide protein, putative [Phytophthora infestans T30-4]|eukprot:XP_002897604.1 secreted RxLR effector peptide protein, putative [Phytophthora infestans T30-4]
MVKGLVILIRLACFNAASADSLVKGSSQQLAVTFERDGLSSRRFLRAPLSEERKLVINLAGFGQATSGTKSWAAKILQTMQHKWSQMRKKSANDMFIKLKLHKSGDQLFKSPSFSKWLTYVLTSSKTNSDITIFSTLAY